MLDLEHTQQTSGPCSLRGSCILFEVCVFLLVRVFSLLLSSSSRKKERGGVIPALPGGAVAAMRAALMNTSVLQQIRQDTGDAAAGEHLLHSKAKLRRNSSALFEFILSSFLAATQKIVDIRWLLLYLEPFLFYAFAHYKQ